LRVWRPVVAGLSPSLRHAGRALPGLLVALVLLLVPGLAAAQPSFPELTGRVVDQAEILSPEQEAALDATLAAHETASSDQIVVVTLSSLQDYDIADYGYQLGRHWGIGQKAIDNGVLLIVAPNERQLRIEVGYGAEAIITDGLASSIIRNTIVPKFKEGDMPAGIEAGVAEIIALLNASPEELAARKAEFEASQPNDELSDSGAMVIFIIIVIVIIVAVISSSGGGRGGGRRMRSSGAGPIVVFGPSSDSFGGGGFGGGDFGGGFGGGGGGFGGGGASGGW
jgi:uncharacterized protein